MVGCCPPYFCRSDPDPQFPPPPLHLLSRELEALGLNFRKVSICSTIVSSHSFRSGVIRSDLDRAILYRLLGKICLAYENNMVAVE